MKGKIFGFYIKKKIIRIKKEISRILKMRIAALTKFTKKF